MLQPLLGWTENDAVRLTPFGVHCKRALRAKHRAMRSLCHGGNHNSPCASLLGFIGFLSCTTHDEIKDFCVSAKAPSVNEQTESRRQGSQKNKVFWEKEEQQKQ